MFPRLLYILLLIPFCLKSQEYLAIPDTVLPSTKGFERNPVWLASRLTAGKVSDKEKFDALFTWVARNIHYNYSQYYSSNGAGKTNIKKVLKRKSGICVDYAALMDTLCNLSGIENTTIYGYVKDEVFDVQDSIYVDNHAWNAVKLDGKWYVYDVTFSTGDLRYDFKKFSRWLIKTEKKFPVDYKKKKVKKKNSFVIIDECGVETRSETYYYKEKKLNRLVRWALHLFSLKIKLYYDKKVKYDYYLADPDLFVVTHHPDDPSWSLLATSEVRKFESDSAFYHLSDTIYYKQLRYGRVCPDCDSYLGQSELNKYHILRKKSFIYNRRNSFISSHCDYHIGNIKHYESLEQEDSLTKVSLLDTSILYLNLARANFKLSLKKLEEDFVLQKSKNKRKQMHLLADNRLHGDFIKSNISKGLSYRRKVRSIITRSPVILKQYKRRGKKARDLKIPDLLPEKKKLTDKDIQELKEQVHVYQLQIDSLHVLTSSLKEKTDSIVNGLSVNFWSRILHHDSLIIPIKKSTELRYFIKDDFKKPVIEVRKQIPVFEKNYDLAMDSIVFDTIDELLRSLNRLYEVINARTSLEFGCYRAKATLTKFNLSEPAELNAFKIILNEQSKSEYCWLRSIQPPVKSILTGFASLRASQKEALKTIVNENKIERSRTSYISHELLRRKKKYKHITITNNKLVRRKLSLVKKDKREYLNMLKRERTRAAKKTE